jgi:hypothetical protein
MAVLDRAHAVLGYSKVAGGLLDRLTAVLAPLADLCGYGVKANRLFDVEPVRSICHSDTGHDARHLARDLANVIGRQDRSGA